MHLGQLQRYVFSLGGMAFGGIVVNNTKGDSDLYKLITAQASTKTLTNRLKLETERGVTSWDLAKLLLSDFTVFE